MKVPQRLSCTDKKAEMVYIPGMSGAYVPNVNVIVALTCLTWSFHQNFGATISLSHALPEL